MGPLLFILNALELLIIVDVVLSWVMPNKEQFPRNLTRQITEPLYAPIQAVLKPEKTGGLDLSPLIILVILYFFEGMLARSAGGGF